MSVVERILQGCRLHIRTAIWAGSAALIAAIAVGVFAAGAIVGYRQACLDFGIHDPLAYQQLLERASRLNPQRAGGIGS